MNDQTLQDCSLYGSRRWVAKTLGMSIHTFDNKRPALEEQGFPKRDHLVGLYLKADVLAWVYRRRQIGDTVKPPETPEQEISFNEDDL